MKLQGVLSLFSLLLYLGLKQVTLASPLSYPSVLSCHGDCSIAQAYILDLKEQIKKLEQSQLEREQNQLSKTLQDLRSTIFDFITNTVNRQKIEDEKLQKQVEEKAKSQAEIENLKREIEKLNKNLDNFQRMAAIDKEERIAERIGNSNHKQDLTDKKDENQMEEITNRQFQVVYILKIENEILKENLVKQKTSLDETKNELESKKKELEENHEKIMKLSNEIQELNSEVASLREIFDSEVASLREIFDSAVASLRENLEESQTQLTDSNHLVEVKSFQLFQTNERLVECKGKLPKTSCEGLSSGIHIIEIPGLALSSVLCNGDIERGGWIVIHKRFDGSVDFNRNWTEYRNGFGNKEGEFFIGLENLHQITNSQAYELYIHLGYIDGSFEFASYNDFKIGNEESQYILESLGEFEGTAVDNMSSYLQAEFSTIDNGYSGCAETVGAWWHYDCITAQLNAKYLDNMSWGDATLKSVQMLIRAT